MSDQQGPYPDGPDHARGYGSGTYGAQPGATNEQVYGAPPPPGQGYGQAAAMPPPGGGGSGPTDAKGFFGALFDFSFTHFVTPIIVKVVYVIAAALLALGLLIVIIGGFASLKAGGILFLIVGPIVALFYLAIIRMTLEFYLSIVRMSEDIHNGAGNIRR